MTSFYVALGAATIEGWAGGWVSNHGHRALGAVLLGIWAVSTVAAFFVEERCGETATWL